MAVPPRSRLSWRSATRIALPGLNQATMLLLIRIFEIPTAETATATIPITATVVFQATQA